MGQNRLNHIMLLNIHFEETEKLSLAAVANTFTSKRDRRRKTLGDQKFVQKLSIPMEKIRLNVYRYTCPLNALQGHPGQSGIK